MFEAVPLFRGFNDCYEYEVWENDLEDIFSYFFLTTDEKYRYAILKLDGEAYYWWRNNYRLCRYWFILQGLLHAWYVPPIYSSEPDCKEPNIEHPSLSRRANQSPILSLQRLRQIQSLQSLSNMGFLMSQS